MKIYDMSYAVEAPCRDASSESQDIRFHGEIGLMSQRMTKTTK